MISRVAVLLAALAVSACSMVVIGYHSAPSLVYWRLDQALDFDSAQGADVRARLDRLHAWHRANELRDYARFLAEVQGRIGSTLSAANVTRVHDEIRRRYLRILDAAAPDAVEVVLGLRGEQLEALDRRFARMREDFRRQRIDVGPERAREDMYHHALKTLERWHGEFDPLARERLRRIAAEIPSDTRLELEDLRRYQGELLLFLRAVVARQVTGRDKIGERLKRFFGRWEEGRTPAYAEYAEKNRLALHRFYAEGASLAAPEQRSRVRREIQHYIDEITALVPQRAASR
ncbi:MAG: DUF6279 family lipoprotein [Burkholderiales bacterium]